MVKDEYTNFVTIHNEEAVAGTMPDATEEDVPFGPFDFMAMEIFAVELRLDVVTKDGVVFPTRSSYSASLATIGTYVTTPPSILQKGVIAERRVTLFNDDAGSSMSTHFEDGKAVMRFDPPLLIAAPKLYLYTKGVAAADNISAVDCRVHYTTVKLSKEKWREAFETWNLVD